MTAITDDLVLPPRRFSLATAIRRNPTITFGAVLLAALIIVAEITYLIDLVASTSLPGDLFKQRLRRHDFNQYITERLAGDFAFALANWLIAAGHADPGEVERLRNELAGTVAECQRRRNSCADLIAEAVTAMEFRASAEDISRMSHAHPTFAEAVKEAALAATDNRALHV